MRDGIAMGVWFPFKLFSSSLFSLFDQLQVVFDHHTDEFVKGDTGTPAELLMGFGGIADQIIDFGGAEETWVGFDVAFPVVDACAGEGGDDEVTDAMGDAGSDDEVVGSVLLEHEPHSFYVVAGEAPIAFGIQIAEDEFVLLAEFDTGDGVRNLAGDEFVASARRFMVKEDAGTGEEVVAFTEVDGDPVAVKFGDAVRAARVEGGLLVLGECLALADHLTC